MSLKENGNWRIVARPANSLFAERKCYKVVISDHLSSEHRSGKAQVAAA
jgi:hypothetical protein